MWTINVDNSRIEYYMWSNSNSSHLWDMKNLWTSGINIPDFAIMLF